MSTPVGHVLEVLQSALDLLTVVPEPPAENLCLIDPLPCRTAIYLGGEVPWDSCNGTGCGDRDGMLWAKMIGINPVSGGSDSSNCPDYTWTAEIGVVRCVASLDDSGNIPTPDQVAADAQQQADDADAIFTALRCCAPADSPLREVALTSWSPLGPTGGCAGGAWTVRGRLSACC